MQWIFVHDDSFHVTAFINKTSMYSKYQSNISKIIYKLKRHTFSPWLPKSEESKPNPPRPYHFTGIKIGCFFESPGNLGFKLWQHGWCTLNPKLKKWASAHWIQNKKIRCTLNTKTKYFKHQNLSETQTFSRPNFFRQFISRPASQGANCRGWVVAKDDNDTW